MNLQAFHRDNLPGARIALSVCPDGNTHNSRTELSALQFSRPVRAGVSTGRNRGSVLVIVLLIATGLITIALYFANSMSLELRAADNRASGVAAEQAIEGGLRYVCSVLTTYATNGYMPELVDYEAEAVPIGISIRPEENSRFWIVGRDPSGMNSTEPYFALVDEAAKLDLNAEWITADTLYTNFAGITYECAEAIIDWRSTNAESASINYGQSGYVPKHAPFESVDELRLLYGTDMELLAGEDLNRNGILDGNEEDFDRNGYATGGLMGYFTTFSRHPNVMPDGSALTNVNDGAQLFDLLELQLGNARAMQITNQVVQAALGQGNPGQGTDIPPHESLLQFYRRSQMTEDEFALVYPWLTATTNAVTIGRVNINTAPVEVLACLPGMTLDAAQQVVNYRESNAINYYSIGWIVNALSGFDQALSALEAGDYITVQTFQYSVDIAAVGPYGRGYRRARFVVDTTTGLPRVIFRQDLSRLGWALGTETREMWVSGFSR